jgi:hypothetical protein
MGSRTTPPTSRLLGEEALFDGARAGVGRLVRTGFDPGVTPESPTRRNREGVGRVVLHPAC